MTKKKDGLPVGCASKWRNLINWFRYKPSKRDSPFHQKGAPPKPTAKSEPHLARVKTGHNPPKGVACSSLGRPDSPWLGRFPALAGLVATCAVASSARSMGVMSSGGTVLSQSPDLDRPSRKPRATAKQHGIYDKNIYLKKIVPPLNCCLPGLVVKRERGKPPRATLRTSGLLAFWPCETLVLKTSVCRSSRGCLALSASMDTMEGV